MNEMSVTGNLLVRGKSNKRRSKSKGFALIGALLGTLAAVSPGSAAQSPQVRLDPDSIPQFAQPLPGLDLGAVVSSGPTGVGLKVYVGADAIVGSTEIHICEFDASVLPSGTPGVTAKTRSWGYIVGPSCPAPGTPEYTQDSYIGPVLVAVRNLPSTLKFVNDLGNADSTGVLAYKYSVDQTIHWADPLDLHATAHCYHLAEDGHIPDPGSECAQNYAGPIPAAVHLHGGIIPPELDGGPDAWVASDGRKGHGYYTSAPAPPNGFTYKYPNAQETAPLIFHDHVLGNLRLNLYAGIAAGYIIEDNTLIPTDATGVWGSTVLGVAACDPASNKCLPSNLPGTAEIVPVIIQDRIFDTNGQLFWPADDAGGILSSPNPEHPYWAPDFFGDVNVVNGKAWPYLEVQPKRYRFLFINASHSRIYNLNLGVPMWVIGTDGGYVDTPIRVDNLLITSGERYEVIIDFKGLNEQNLILRNTAEAPYPNGTAPKPTTLGHVMQFRVAAADAADTSFDPASGNRIRGKEAQIVRLVKPTKGKLAVKKKNVAVTRQLVFNDVDGASKTVTNPVTGEPGTTYLGGRLEILMNNTKWSGESDRTYGDFTPITLNGVTNNYSEIVQEGNIEVWEFVNLTQVSHAQHLHGVAFQVLNRQDFNKGAYMAAYATAFPGGAFIPGFGPPLDYRPSSASGKKYGGNPDIKPYLQGKVIPPRPEESAWKDTVITLPGQVTRVAVRYTPSDLPISAKAQDRYFPFDSSGGNQNGFVHHCHMTEHEDNEMMRISLVTLNPDAPAPASRLLKKGIDY
ncbi:Multicopper oxidase, type 2 precursor [Candidatus Methylomirabilis oxygeniifera]|uniref:Multicopper oxidase, type 2 n=1 Tax=Methylomirabilis oxygeniifera TaxID=671143 RepID=D5ML08_METO1|nr:Multicopper oxidase, type 2 precursor [Candidatus Methylomirabilis oxyfera]